MRHTFLLIYFVAIASSVNAQNRVGLEIRTSINITYNGSSLSHGSFGLSSYKITREGNPTTTSYSAGLLYKANPKINLRLHFGRHQNGRIIDLTTRNDISMTADYQNVDSPYSFSQITPSISYNIIDSKLTLPIEVGLSINKATNIEDVFFVFLKKYNYDLRISSGVQYHIAEMHIGINAVLSKSITEYQGKYEYGKYLPYQIGLELAVGYRFI